MMLSKEDQSALLDLTWHWESAYTFCVTDGIWQAVPAVDPSAVLTADTADDLRAKEGPSGLRLSPGHTEADPRRAHVDITGGEHGDAAACRDQLAGLGAALRQGSMMCAVS
jgi:hypothetical protein